MWWVYNITAVLIFCVSARQFLKATTEGINWQRRSDFSLRALRFEKRYRMFAWGMMTFIWIYLCAVSFLHSFQQADL